MQQCRRSCAAVIESDCCTSGIQFILSHRAFHAVADNHRVAGTASGCGAWFLQHFECSRRFPRLKQSFDAFFLHFIRKIEVESSGDSFAGPIPRPLVIPPIGASILTCTLASASVGRPAKTPGNCQLVTTPISSPEAPGCATSFSRGTETPAPFRNSPAWRNSNDSHKRRLGSLSRMVTGRPFVADSRADRRRRRPQAIQHRNSQPDGQSMQLVEVMR